MAAITLVKDPSPPATDTLTSPITIPDGTTLISTKQHNGIIDRIGGESPLTGSRAVELDADGNIIASDVTAVELNYLDGVTSAIQTQINAKKKFYIPCLFVSPEGLIAYPDIHDLATASSKASGAVFPDGATASTFNIKPLLPLPTDLNGTPNLKLNVEFISHGTEATNVNVRLTASSRWILQDGTENWDLAFDAEAEETFAMPTTLEFGKVYTVDLDAPTIAADDNGLLKLARDPTDAADVHPQDIQALRSWLTGDLA